MGRQTHPIFKSPRRAHLVGSRVEGLEWEVSHPPQDLSHSDNRCQSLGLGRLLEEDRSASPSSRRSSRFLLSSGEQELLELERVDRRLTYSPVSCTSPEGSGSPGRDRQQHHQSLHQSHGRQVQGAVGNSSQTVVDSSETRIPGASSALARSRQSSSRPALQVAKRQVRLQAESSHLQSSGQTVGPPQHRPLRQSAQQPDSSICSLAARSAGSIHRRPDSASATRESLVLPSRRHYQQSSGEGHQRAGNHYPGSPSMALETMVADPDSTQDRQTLHSRQSSRDSTSSRTQHSFSVLPPSSSYLEDLRSALSDRSVSEKQISWVIKGSPKYARSLWARWKTWCQSEGLSPLTCLSFEDFSFDSAVAQFASFLAHIASDVANHGTLCTYRACINTFLQTVFNCCSLSEQPAVSAIMKGVNKVHPSQPRWALEETYWDPGLIISYYADKPDNCSLSTPELARKSFVLFAVTCWPRCSDAERCEQGTSFSTPLGY